MTLVERISARPSMQRRALALLLLAVGIVLLWAGILAPAHWIFVSQDEWRTDVRRELARSLGKAASEPELRKRLAALPTASLWGKFYDTKQGEDASALIQRDVVNVGTAAGVSVQAVVSLPKVEEAGLVGYGIRFTAAMTADQLKKFVDALRGNPHYVRVERLSVTAPQVQQLDQNAPLTITMEVYGYSRSGDLQATDSRSPRERGSS